MCSATKSSSVADLHSAALSRSGENAASKMKTILKINTVCNAWTAMQGILKSLSNISSVLADTIRKYFLLLENQFFMPPSTYNHYVKTKLGLTCSCSSLSLFLGFCPFALCNPYTEKNSSCSSRVLSAYQKQHDTNKVQQIPVQPPHCIGE